MTSIDWYIDLPTDLVYIHMDLNTRVRSKTHDPQTLLTFSNHHFGRTRILKVDWAVGAIRIPIIACLMEVSGRFISRILRLIRYAGTSHSDRSGTFLRHSIYSSRNL